MGERILNYLAWGFQQFLLLSVWILRTSLNWASTQPRQAFIFVLVCVIHICWVVQAQKQSELPLQTKASKRVHVQTVKLQPKTPPKPIAKKPARPPARKPPPPKKPVVKKEAEPKPAPQPTVVKKKEPPKPSSKPAPEKALSSTESTYQKHRAALIEQIEKQMDLIEPLSSFPKEEEEEAPIEETTVSSSPNLFELTGAHPYNEELVKRLQLLLKLPAYGDVRVKLTLKNDGSVQAVEVLGSESPQNQAYVEQVLPDLKFMGFGSHFSGQRTHSFILTLTNDV